VLAGSVTLKRAREAGGRVLRRYPRSGSGSVSTGQCPLGPGKAPFLEVCSAWLDEALHSLV